MCGICGFTGRFASRDLENAALQRMTAKLLHRGPDSSGIYVDDHVALGFRRLSFVDLSGGNQPLFSEDGSLVLVCNGEIYNHRELRKHLQGAHQFRTGTDVEVILHLYEEYGLDLFDKLNGQFAFALFDRNTSTLILARDHCGICPCFYTECGGCLIFASEIKAILEHPLVRPEVNLTGLDQILSLPGLVSPATMFKGIHSLRPGHYLVRKNGSIEERQFWDLNYPPDGAAYNRSENEYVEELSATLADAVRLRLEAEVPVGFYLSGGLDSSLIGAFVHKSRPSERVHSFGIDFEEARFSESEYQAAVARHIGSCHHSIPFGWQQIAERLDRVIYHCECPIKETYNTASLALSDRARAAGVPAILTGEGADELFAGYVGYRFDEFRHRTDSVQNGARSAEDGIRERLWGDPRLFYEFDYGAHGALRRSLYSPDVRARFQEFDCLNGAVVNRDQVRGRHFIHQRSYLDFKLRMSDHLLSDHGDRMVLANSVEARYPFLDRRVIDLALQMPPALKLNGFTEKYVLRKIAKPLLPPKVARREKYAFVAPGSPYLLGQDLEFVEDILSTSRIRNEGYFDPVRINELKRQYSQPGFQLNLPFETDLLIVVLTFGLFLQTFHLPSLN